MASNVELPPLPAEAVLRSKDKLLVTLPCRVRQPGTAFIKSEAALVSHTVGGNEEAA